MVYMGWGTSTGAGAASTSGGNGVACTGLEVVTAEVLAPEDGLGGVGRGAVWAGGSGAGAGVGGTNGLGRLSLRRVFLALRL